MTPPIFATIDKISPGRRTYEQQIYLGNSLGAIEDLAQASTYIGFSLSKPKKVKMAWDKILERICQAEDGIECMKDGLGDYFKSRREAVLMYSGKRLL